MLNIRSVDPYYTVHSCKHTRYLLLLLILKHILTRDLLLTTLYFFSATFQDKILYVLYFTATFQIESL